MTDAVKDAGSPHGACPPRHRLPKVRYRSSLVTRFPRLFVIAARPGHASDAGLSIGTGITLLLLKRFGMQLGVSNPLDPGSLAGLVSFCSHRVPPLASFQRCARGAQIWCRPCVSRTLLNKPYAASGGYANRANYPQGGTDNQCENPESTVERLLRGRLITARRNRPFVRGM
jgi:hypothetical protein